MAHIEEFKRENLGSAFNLVTRALRLYIVGKLENEEGEGWPRVYRNFLSDVQKNNWDSDYKNGIKPEELIDFGNLFSFSKNNKAFFKEDIGFKKTNNLPTYFSDLSEIRNKWAHHNAITEEDFERAFMYMIMLSQLLGMDELTEKIKDLKDRKKKQIENKSPSEIQRHGGMIPWYGHITPHKDIKEGLLDESVFAANLAQVALGTGRDIYQDPEKFFSKTYFTLGLKNLAKRVNEGLSKKTDSENRVISLETGFGGGKTHSLISLYHFIKMGKKANSETTLQELVSYTGEIKYDQANIAVFTNTTNDPTQGRNAEGIHINTLWGELAIQLGGKEAYELIRKNDEQRTSPKGLFSKILEKSAPALILIDELADYCVTASGVTVGTTSLADQTISFIQELSEAVAAIPHVVLVATLPASVDEVASSPEGSRILNNLRGRLSRISADTKPVADEEIFEVIRRRLFEDLGDIRERNLVIKKYMDYYEDLVKNNEIPKKAGRSEYKEKLYKSYPFHPELIDMFRVRWASNHDFQRTRGVLRLLASIVSDIWKRRDSLTGNNALIHTSDVIFGNLDALSSQLKRLFGNGFEAVISADVSGGGSNAFLVDQEKMEFSNHRITQGVASTILLGSFGSEGVNKGLNVGEIKLCVSKPESFNHNNINAALDEFEAHAYYLYYGAAGGGARRYWFHTKPNINILINKTRQDISNDKVNSEILKRLNKAKEYIREINVLVNPTSDVPEQKRLTMVICGPDKISENGDISPLAADYIKKIATKKGDSERLYRNTILFLLCSSQGYSKLTTVIIDYLACQKVRDDYQHQLDEEQRKDLNTKIKDGNEVIEVELANAYSKIVKHRQKEGIKHLIIHEFKGSLENQIRNNILDRLKTDEWIVEGVGVGLLKKSNLFPDEENSFQVKNIYEAFLRFDDKPMITGPDAIQKSLLKYCDNGTFAIASGEGPNNFDRVFYQEVVNFFDVTDENFWIVDKSFYQPEKPEPQPVQPPDGTPAGGGEQPVPQPGPGSPEPAPAKKINSVTVSGKVDMANYSQIFSSFIMPLRNNRVEIEVKIKGKSTDSNPLSENSQTYKVLKESARQLGLDLEEE